MKSQIDRTLELVLELNKVAKDFGYNLEVDENEDVYHEGYSSQQIKKMDLSLPKEVVFSDQLFPLSVASAMEAAERREYSKEMKKARISALEDALLKIDLLGGGAEYVDSDLNFISAKAGIVSAEIDEKSNSLTVEILNPEHLINSMIHGVGRFYPDLSAFESATNEEIIAGFHHLKDYFSIYGERQPSGELSSQFTPGIDEAYFLEEIKFNIAQLSLAEVAENCIEYCGDSEDISEDEVIVKAAGLTRFSKEDLKKEIQKQSQAK